MTVVGRIKEACRKKGIAISKLEKDLGFGNGYISQLRAGKIRADRLNAIAEYLGEDAQYLLYGDEWLYSGAPGMNDDDDDLMEFATELQIMKDDPKTRSLLRAGRGLTREQLQAVETLMLQMRGWNANN